MTEFTREEAVAAEELSRAANRITTTLSRVRNLEAALETARSAINTLKDGLSPNSYRVPYSGSKPEKFVDIAAEAVSGITKMLGR